MVPEGVMSNTLNVLPTVHCYDKINCVSGVLKTTLYGPNSQIIFSLLLVLVTMKLDIFTVSFLNIGLVHLA